MLTRDYTARHSCAPNAARAITGLLKRQQRRKHWRAAGAAAVFFARELLIGALAVAAVFAAIAFTKNEPIDVSDIDAALSAPTLFECPGNAPPVVRTTL